MKEMSTAVHVAKNFDMITSNKMLRTLEEKSEAWKVS